MIRGQKYYSIDTWWDNVKMGKQALRQKIQLSICNTETGPVKWSSDRNTGVSKIIWRYRRRWAWKFLTCCL